MIQWQAKTAWLGTSTAQIATEVLYCCLGLSQNSWLPKLDSWIHRETHQPLIRGPFRYRIYGSYPPKLPPLGPHPNISQLKWQVWAQEHTVHKVSFSCPGALESSHVHSSCLVKVKKWNRSFARICGANTWDAQCRTFGRRHSAPFRPRLHRQRCDHGLHLTTELSER